MGNVQGGTDKVKEIEGGTAGMDHVQRSTATVGEVEGGRAGVGKKKTVPLK